MKHIIPLATLLLTPLAALAALIFLPALLQAQTLTLKDADTVAAEFRVDGTGKIAVMLKFADGKAQTLLGAVKADALKRIVEKTARKRRRCCRWPMAGSSSRARAYGFNITAARI